MKTFYEMLQILEGSKNGGGRAYFEAMDLDHPPDDEEINYDGLVVGDDDNDFCNASVSGTDSSWSLDPGGIFVRGYVPTGKENPISKPKYEEPGKYSSRGGTNFENPGELLENMPPDLARKCSDFIDAEVRRYIGSYDPNDYRDDDGPGDRKWDDQDQAVYDRSLWLGGEKY